MDDAVIKSKDGKEARDRLVAFVGDQMAMLKEKKNAYATSARPSSLFRALGGRGLPDTLGTDGENGKKIKD